MARCVAVIALLMLGSCHVAHATEEQRRLLGNWTFSVTGPVPCEAGQMSLDREEDSAWLATLNGEWSCGTGPTFVVSVIPLANTAGGLDFRKADGGGAYQYEWVFDVTWTEDAIQGRDDQGNVFIATRVTK